MTVLILGHTTRYHKHIVKLKTNFFSLDDFKKVSKAVAGVELNDHLVDLVFVIFDENGMS